MGSCWEHRSFIWKKCWKPFFTIVIPILLSTVFIWEGVTLDPPIPKWKQPRGAFVILLMASYWITECLPLPVTALCPIFLFPLLQISDTETVTKSYLSSSVLLLLSGCIIALAFEYSNLHNRIALMVIRVVGARVPILLLGIMATSVFLSMWMNNTSTTAMMVPIVDVIMKEFMNADTEDIPTTEDVPPIATEEEAVKLPSTAKEDGGLKKPSSAAPVKRTSRFGLDPASDVRINTSPVDDSQEKTVKIVDETITEKTATVASNAEKESRSIKIMFLLGVAWAANLGGTGIITGTATNIIAQDEAGRESKRTANVTDVKKCQAALDLEFLTWMEFNILPMIISALLTWLILILYFRGIPKCCCFWRKQSEIEINASTAQKAVTKNIEKAINAKYAQLGPISLHEIFVVTIFLLLVVGWISGGKTGWFQLFKEKTTDKSGKETLNYYPHDAIPAIFLCLFLFIIPKEKKYYKNFMKGGLGDGMQDPVLQWKLVETKVPWGPLILIGGGGAISGGIKASGVGAAIGQFLKNNEALKSLQPWAFMIIILIIVAILTTIASNTATAAILSPVLISLSTSKGIHPLYMLVVPTVAASYAFILPISTPPNAIVFDKSDMKQSEMACCGIIVTLITNASLFLCVHTYNELIWNFNSYVNYCEKIK